MPRKASHTGRSALGYFLAMSRRRDPVAHAGCPRRLLARAAVVGIRVFRTLTVLPGSRGRCVGPRVRDLSTAAARFYNVRQLNCIPKGKKKTIKNISITTLCYGGVPRRGFSEGLLRKIRRKGLEKVFFGNLKHVIFSRLFIPACNSTSEVPALPYTTYAQER